MGKDFRGKSLFVSELLMHEMSLESKSILGLITILALKGVLKISEASH